MQSGSIPILVKRSFSKVQCESDPSPKIFAVVKIPGRFCEIGKVNLIYSLRPRKNVRIQKSGYTGKLIKKYVCEPNLTGN